MKRMKELDQEKGEKRQTWGVGVGCLGEDGIIETQKECVKKEKVLLRARESLD